jgi:hypothetical protein
MFSVGYQWNIEILFTLFWQPLMTQVSCYVDLLRFLLDGNIRRRLQVLPKDVVKQTYFASICKHMPELLQCCSPSVG